MTKQTLEGAHNTLNFKCLGSKLIFVYKEIVIQVYKLVFTWTFQCGRHCALKRMGRELSTILPISPSWAGRHSTWVGLSRYVKVQFKGFNDYFQLHQEMQVAS